MPDTSGLQPVGVRFVTENEAEFSKLIASMTDAVSALTQQLTGLVNNITRMNGSLTASRSDQIAFQSGITSAGTALGGFGGIAGTVAVTLGNILANAIQTVIGKVSQFFNSLKGLGMEALQTAGRFEQMTQVAYMMGRVQGYATEEVDKFIKSIRDSGIEAGVAADIVTQFAQANLKMADAEKLANVAKDAAVISNSNSTATLERLKYGILTYNTETLRTAGLTIISDQAMQNYAKSINKSANALTPMERQQAMLNAVLEEGIKINGAYDLSLTSPYKLMLSMERVVNDVRVALGAPFQDAWFNLVSIQYEFTKVLRMVIEDSNKLGPIFQNIGALAAVVTGYIKDFALSFINTTDAMGKVVKGGGPLIVWLTDMANKVQTFITDSFQWGVDLIVQFADGIINGASTVLVGAMDFIGGILAGWLQPSSPPKVAPKVDKWGLETMAQWLHGFSEADFSILNSIQGPLQQALSTVMSADSSKAMMVDLTKGIVESIAKGNVDESIISKISAATGQYGKEVSDLVRMQMQMAIATDAVRQAEEALVASRKKETEAGDKLQSMYKEYNALVASGAEPKLLKSKRDQIKAQQNIVKSATGERVEKEKALRTQQESLAPLQQALKLQEAVVSQLIKQAGLQQKIAGAGGGGKGGATPPKTAGAGTGGTGGATKIINEAFEKLKENIRNKLSTMFKPLIDKWNSVVAPGGPLSVIAEKWQWFSSIVVQVWEQKIKPALDGLWKWFEEHKTEILNVIQGILVGFAAFKIISGIVGTVIGFASSISTLVVAVTKAGGIISWIVGILGGPLTVTIAVIAGLVALFTAAWLNNWGGIRDTLTAFWYNTALPVLVELQKWLETNIPIAIAAVVKWWNTVLLPAIGKVWEWVQSNLFPLFDKLWNWLAINIPIAIQSLANFWNTVLLPAIQAVGLWIEGTLIPTFVKIWEWLATNIPVAIQTLSNFWNTVLLPAIQTVWAWIEGTLIPTLVNIWNWLATNIPIAIQSLANFWNTVLLPAIQAVWAWIEGTLIPTFVNIWNWLQVTIPAALAWLSNVWQTVLLPAITSVWDYINKYLIPLFKEIVAFAKVGISNALMFLSTVWTNVLLPAITAIWNFWVDHFKPMLDALVGMLSVSLGNAIKLVGAYIDWFAGIWRNNLLPIMTSVYKFIADLILPAWANMLRVMTDVGNFIKKTFGPILDDLTKFAMARFEKGLSVIGGIVDAITRAFNALKSAFSSFNPPAWLTPGSPTPFEIGLTGINDQLKELTRAQMPRLKMQLEAVNSAEADSILANMRMMSTGQRNNSVTNQYNLGGVVTTQSPSGIQQSFGMIQVLSQ